MLMTDPEPLTDDALMARIAALAATSRESTADLIAHLVELERRNLHLALGFKSLFGYCRRVLHCSEAGAYDRMRAAHAARKFPVVTAMLAEGLLHLTAVRLLWPHLNDENHLALLGGAIHKSAREVRKLLAGWFPSPDVPSSVRKLPEARREAPTARPAGPGGGPAPAAAAPLPLRAPGVGDSPTAERPRAVPSMPVRTTVSPLAPGRYEFRFTGDEETAEMLREARELLSHSIPDGDMAAIMKRGLALVLADAKRRRHAATDHPRAPRTIAHESRAIPAHVERAVWDRDRGQCSFVGIKGWRCEERLFLEYHHLTPWIVGGEPSVENITLRCKAHNKYEAKVYFEPIRRAMEAQL
jgi:hypothetical protein